LLRSASAPSAKKTAPAGPGILERRMQKGFTSMEFAALLVIGIVIGLGGFIVYHFLSKLW